MVIFMIESDLIFPRKKIKYLQALKIIFLNCSWMAWKSWLKVIL